MHIKFIITLLISFNVLALTPEAEKGKETIAICMSCHNTELNPALAPPFYGVQNKYKQVYGDKQVFIQAISDWAKKPSVENSLMKKPIQMLGIMPAMPLPDNMLSNIGAFIYEEDFPPPCTHWANDMQKSNGQTAGNGQGRGKGQGGNHDAMINMKYNQLCKQ